MFGRIARIGVVILFLGLPSAPLVAGEGEGPEPVSWYTSADKARDAAREGKKLIIAHLRVGSCDWCGRMERETHPDRRVIAVLTGVVPLWLDLDRSGKRIGRDLMRKAGLRTVPATLILDDELGVVLAVGGFKSPENFKHQVGGGLEAYKVRKSLLSRVQAGEADYGNMWAYLRSCHVLGLSGEVLAQGRKTLAMDWAGERHDADIAFFLAKAMGPVDPGYGKARARVLEFDPLNATGHYDELVIDEAVVLARGSRSAGEARANLPRARKLLLDRLAAKQGKARPGKAQTMYWILFQLGGGDLGERKALLSKGIALAPKTELARTMTEAMKKLD